MPSNFLAMLAGKDWLDAGNFPEMAFRSKAIEVTGANTFRIHGELTMNGVTKPLVLEPATTAATPRTRTSRAHASDSPRRASSADRTSA